MTKSDELINQINETNDIGLMKELLKHNSYLFYEGKETEIADDVFDKYEKAVQLAEPNFRHRDLIDINDFQGEQVPHKVTYRPFSKVNDLTNMTDDWFNTIQSKYITCPKWDGSSVAIYMVDGKISYILSRHDDVLGIVQTDKLKAKAEEAIRNRFRTTTNRPLTDVKCILAECVAVMEDGKSNRALSNGLVNSKYQQESVDKYGHLMIFDVIYNDNTYEPNIYYQLTLDQFKSIRDTGKFMTDVGDIICDGIVNYSRDFNNITLDIHKIYYNDSALSTIRSISWDVSWGTGVYHPVANFDAVQLEGTNVSRAAMSNYKTVVQNGMFPGAKIKVIKANSTIPKIIEVSSPVYSKSDSIEKYYDESTRVTDLICPWCGEHLVKFGNTDLVCPSKSCRQKVSMVISRMLSALHVGQEVTNKLVSMNFDNLTEFIDLIDSIRIRDKFRVFTLENIDMVAFFTALGIPRFQGSKVDLISNDWNNCSNKSNEEFEKILGKYFSDLNWSYYRYIRETIDYILQHILI